MKNLVLNYHNTFKLKDPLFKNEKLCLNLITKEVYLYSKQVSENDCQNTYTESKIQSCLSSWKINIPASERLISFEFVSTVSCLCAVSLEGDVTFINEKENTVDVVGSFTDKILASCWSPDQELLAIVTGALSLVLLIPTIDPLDGSATLDSISEISLEQSDFGENKFINVGWGKKETQFHGSEGKEAAKKSKCIDVNVDPSDDRFPRITWRGDGQLFAISYVSNISGSRKFRVLNRESVILYTGEDVQGLEQSFAWLPSGSLIASSQRLSNKHNIVFFEKNGLQHGQFTLAFKPDQMVVKELVWNSSSSVLLVWAESLETENESLIQLWTVGNYHWYLKEEFKFEEKIKDVCWDPDNPFILHVLMAQELHEFRFNYNQNRSIGQSASDLAQVSVVDGKKLLVTPFRQCVVPPPISAYEINFPDQIHAVMYAPVASIKKDDSSLVEDSGFLETSDPPGGNSNNLCVFHGQDTLTFLIQANHNEPTNDSDCKVAITGAGGNGFVVKSKVHKVLSQIKISLPNVSKENLAPGTFYNWFWVSKTVLVCCYFDFINHYLQIFDLENVGTEDEKLISRNPYLLEEPPLTIFGPNDGSFICLQFASGIFAQFDFIERKKWVDQEGKEIVMPPLSDNVILLPCSEDKVYLPLGLSTKNVLYLGNTKVLTDCTSMLRHTDHLLLTTTSHSLIVVPLDINLILSVKDKKEELSNIGTRKLERGSRLVTAVPCDTRVLLQMPRGNLELINPRPLVVHTLKRLLNQHNYHEAVDIMRKNRIDMNLIYDHDPQDFLNHVEVYVRSVNNPHWIDLFVATLNNDDVTLTAYATSYLRNNKYPSEMGELFTNKIESVSVSLRNAMIALDEEKFLLSILTTYVKSPKGEMHLALIKLKEMKSSDKTYKVSFGEGLKHLLYVADANELCDVALGTYDFNLVMMIFEQSQKDPKEYLPFLNELKKLKGDYQKFKINVHLKLYKKALGCITDFEHYKDECIALIKKHCLYLDALEIFPKDSSLYKDSCDAYADYLSQKGYDNEAGAFYFRAGNYQRALNAYQKTTNWRRAIMTAFAMKLSKIEISNLYHDLIDHLIVKNLHCDAAIIYEKYIQSDEDAIACYIKALKWEEAFLLAAKNMREDIVLTLIKPAVAEQHENYKQEIQSKKESFLQYYNRLIIVRESKFDQHLNFLDDPDGFDIDVDLCSNTSTVTGFSHRLSTATRSSGMSGRSYRSSKNRRKLDRKKYSTKEGSNFEDIGIVAVLHDLYLSVDAMAISVSEFNRVLLNLGEDAKAKDLQLLLSVLIQEIIRKKFDVWINCAPAPEEGSVEFGSELTTNNAVNQIHQNQTGQISFFNQRLEELEPHLRFPPKLDNISNWKLYSLK